MRLCTRAGATGWVYARKTAGLGMHGTLRWGATSYDLGAIDIYGHHDWSAGFMRRETFWNWGCLAGPTSDGRIAGLNVSCGVNETGVTENCFWVDGRLHKVDTVAFDYDQRDVMKPWRLCSADGRVALDFVPEGMHVERLNAVILADQFPSTLRPLHRDPSRRRPASGSRSRTCSRLLRGPLREVVTSPESIGSALRVSLDDAMTEGSLETSMTQVV